MPQVAKPMSAKKVDALKAGAHAVGGAAGLYIVVAQSGGRSWLLRASVNGKRREFGLGSYPAITLAEARTKALEARERISQGIDPIQHRRATQAEQEGRKTFGEVAEIVIQQKQDEARNAKHAAQWRSTLETYCKPIWSIDVDAITIHDVLTVLKPIWVSRTETATRVRQRIEAVLATAIVHGWRQGDNVAGWDRYLKHAGLGSPATLKKKRWEALGKKGGHHAALDWQDAQEFMAKLREESTLTARLVEFIMLTAARSGEARFATWDEVDLESRVWTIPAERMKAGREHRVPLSDAAVRLLEGMPRMYESDIVFPGNRGRRTSENTPAQVIKRLGYGVTVHGFRSTFRDWAAECTNTPNHVAEMALAHTIKNAAEAAYRRGDLLEKRRALMEEWAGFLEGKSPDTVAGA
ncbi:tyrosine-type recombinase/integrase [Salinicola sp. V024]|uniref:tyrosine-type recombinase/integrase n=1 Tax=Salinicola sp. V024 TaxID=3459609 RepID=UPI0040439FA8